MNTDHLYNLLPAIYRLRDAEQGYPLQALLRVIEEQVNVVEADIAQLYDNWFIETCEDWAVPYIGDLIGWRQVHEAGEPGSAATTRDRERNKILIPRRELANTIRYRRRKGTLALLELLANDVAGWPARAVEFFRLLGGTQNINFSHERRGGTVDVRRGARLNLIDGAFDRMGHTVDVRRINSNRATGSYNIQSVGLFVCRLKSYPSTLSRAHCAENIGPDCFTFSVLGNDAPLFTEAVRETDPTGIAQEINLPVAIRRRAFESSKRVNRITRTRASEVYYGEGKSVAIWIRKRKRDRGDTSERELIPAGRIIPADLSGWHYRPRRDLVAVDPVLGRIVFPSGHCPKDGVWVSYHYGFSADIGGGEYDRPLSQPQKHKLYRVGPEEKFHTINAALRQWRKNDATENPNAVIEITDSGVYVEQINIHLRGRQSLQLRAANGKKPVIRLLDWHTDRPDALTVEGGKGSRFTLDGLLISGRSVSIEGEISEARIRHCTLVPGWTIGSDCEPHRPAEPSLELLCPHARVEIEKSILGSIQVHPLMTNAHPNDAHESKEKAKSPAAESGCYGIGYGFRVDPICLHISDSIVDATSPRGEAIGAPGCVVAHARLTIERSTVFGQVQVHSIDLAENSIFEGKITVARSQQGCMRFCYVTPGSRTPKRYQCQPDLVTKDKTGEAKTQAETQVKPRFNSTRYGRPDYCQLADDCAEEIKRGADDESEMGVFHDLYQPQRLANLRARLDEYTPAGMDAAIIFMN
ncbi:MAG TPA: hypothetical protein VJX74_04175 [Blastocatellia bacterium]|nr:hypothetical protein [Blastocatellia bacterium]